MKSFIKQFVAIIKGDDAEVLAQKTYRQASSALKSQISSLEGDTINFEDKVTEAEEALAMARLNNGVKITDRDQYVQNLVNAKNRLSDAQDDLQEHVDLINFLKQEFELLEA